MQDVEMRVGKMVERKGGQLLGCSLIQCENNLDFCCYCQEPHIGKVDGIALPVCLSYVGKFLDED